MPGYLQRLTSAGARIVPSRRIIAARRAVAPIVFGQEPVGVGMAMPSPPAVVPPSAARVAEVVRLAPSVETVENVDVTEPMIAVQPAARGEPVAPVVAAPQSVQPLSHEPERSPARIAVDPLRSEEQAPELRLAPEAVPIPFTAMPELPIPAQPTDDKTGTRKADCEPLPALPQMTVLTPSGTHLLSAVRTPEKSLLRLPRIEMVPLAPAQASPPMSGAPSHPSTKPIEPKLPDAQVDLSLPSPAEEPTAVPGVQPVPRMPHDTPEPRSISTSVPEPRRVAAAASTSAPSGGLTIQRLEVQIVERPRNEISEPQPAPVGPIGSAWDWPDRRHQGRVW